MPKVINMGIPWDGYILSNEFKHFTIHFKPLLYTSPWMLIHYSISDDNTFNFRLSHPEIPGSHIKVICTECESMVKAHQIILNAQMNITAPAPDNDRPEGCDFGDIFKRKHWSRNNLYFYFNNLSEEEIEQESILSILRSIDSGLLIDTSIIEIDEDHSQFLPIEFWGSESVVQGEIIPLILKFNNSFTIPAEYTCTFKSSNGEVFIEDEALYFEGQQVGSQILQLYITNLSGDTILKEITIEVL